VYNRSSRNNLKSKEEAVKDGEGWLDLDELKAIVGE
jgi:hypothetical protein